MKDRVVFYGASVTSRSKTQAREIIDRAIHICELLRKHGFQCHADSEDGISYLTGFGFSKRNLIRESLKVAL